MKSKSYLYLSFGLAMKYCKYVLVIGIANVTASLLSAVILMSYKPEKKLS